MLAKAVLGVLGLLMLIMGIACIIVSKKYSDWEDKEYKHLKNKDAPTTLNKTTMTIGIILTVIGSMLLVWSMYIHAYPLHAAKAGLTVKHK
jgi:uncharacterized membrane protein